MNETQAIEYIHSRLTFGIKPGMERIGALCGALGNLQRSLRFIHVAGTNGKGSISAMIACALTQAGFKTGLFTSPYVIDFRERIRLDGEMIPPGQLARTVERVKAACDMLDAQGIVSTEFEAITAAAFLWFAQRSCDVVVLETGLGGELDSTNIIDTPLVSVISSISMDHTAVLGDSIEKIAAQKSGIIKPGGVTVLYPEQRPAARRVIERAARERANRLVVPDMSRCRVTEESLAGTLADFDGLTVHIPFIGAHMVKNAATALCALRECGLDVSERHMALGLARAQMPARMEVIGRGRVILDGGHNEGCALALRAALEKFALRPTTAVCALMGDKDCRAYLRTLAPMFDKMYLTAPDNPRSAAPRELQALASEYCKDCVAVDSSLDACRAALDDVRSSGGTAVVCGSFYLAGEVRDFLLKNF